jgi:hypothetical protein
MPERSTAVTNADLVGIVFMFVNAVIKTPQE